MTNLIYYAAPVFLALVLVEVALDAWMRRELYRAKDTAASLTMGVGNLLVGIFSKAMIFGLLVWVYQFRLWELPNAWWVWVALFFAEDFTYYVFHRASHEVRFFWAAHVVHHSSQRYNLGTALRQTWTGFMGSFVFWLWLPLVGFHPVMIMTTQAISLIYQFWIHTELVRRLGFLEAVLNTPSHHRVHHAVNPRYLDRNHAGVLIIWDKLCGTFEDERERPEYGLTRNINTYNPLRIAVHEWVDMARDAWHAPTWRARFLYVFGPPGWRHDGSGKTSAEVRAQGRAAAAAARA